MSEVRMEPLTPTRRSVRNAKFAQLRRDHPRMYVAYREVWDCDELQELFVLAVAATFTELVERVGELPEHLREGSQAEFLHPLGVAMAYANS